MLIPNTAWKDYSSNTNYAFDAYDHDEKQNGKARNGANSRSSTATMHNGLSQQTTLQMSHSPNKSQYYDISRNGNRYGDQARHHNKNGHDRHHYNQHHAAVAASYADRSYSLPRTVIQPQNPNQMAAAGYYTQDRRAAKNNVNGSSQNQASRSNGEERTERTHHRQHPQAMERTTQGGGGADTPDFYFMPSQRKYSGEVVRVYVDYNKDPK